MISLSAYVHILQIKTTNIQRLSNQLEGVHRISDQVVLTECDKIK